jgi:D-glycero-D-manno-heptose 1,7-bisphosphate phosphatase
LSAARLAPGGTAFLDRDGTINVGAAEGEYVVSAGEVELLPGAAEAIRLLNELPAKVVVVTNQRGIALGRMSEEDLAAVTAELDRQLAAAGAHLDASFHCPHEKGSCECRKPGPGMFRRAAAEVPGVRLEGAAMVGDSALDVEAGNRLALTTVRLGPSAAGDPEPDHESPDLLAAVRWLLADVDSRR